MTIVAGGVQPSAVNVTHSTGIYTFVNDAGDTSGISGSASVTMSGAGTLVLGGQNTFTGGIKLAGGVTQISADNQLGAAGGNVTFDGGALQITADNVTLTRAFTMNAGGGTLDTNGHAVAITGSAFGGVGGFSKAGQGALSQLLAGLGTPDRPRSSAARCNSIPAPPPSPSPRRLHPAALLAISSSSARSG